MERVERIFGIYFKFKKRNSLKFKLDFDIVPSEKKIDYHSKLLFLGSCFSDDISAKLTKVGFDVVSNPFGTLFHPLSIASLFEDLDFDELIFERGDLWFSWVSSGNVYNSSKVELIKKLKSLKKNLIYSISNTDFIFITFGTSFGYRLISSNKFVANCHKMPSSLFQKELTDIEEMRLKWEQIISIIKNINPNIEIVFTVSPVRHIKDGIIENNLSKARLFQLIHQLKGNYFPSFEIIQDELRDYRFYKEDLIHPNELAIDYVFDKFKKVYFENSTNAIVNEVDSFKQMESHKVLYPESNQTTQFQNHLIQKRNELIHKYPFVKW
jgi:lysophospholipase L1-like esterase